MASYVKTLGDAVVTALNSAGSGAFSESFTAYFDFDPNFEKLSGAETTVVVSLGTSEFSTATIAQDQARDRINISIIKSVAATESGNDADLIDGMISLLEEIRWFFRSELVHESQATESAYLGGESVNRGDLGQRMYRQTLQITFDSYRNG
jgi:hypothetical protein